MDISTMYFRVYKPAEEESSIESSLRLLFLLEGELRIRCQEEVYSLRGEDVILLSAGMGTEILSCRDALVAECSYEINYVTRLLRNREILFYCNSAADKTRSYRELRDLLLRLTAEYTSAGGEEDLLMDSLLLAVLDTLVKHFSASAGSGARREAAEDQRMREIMQYISANLNREISLTELAEQMYVSTSTLSRVFKKSTGVYFADYVMQLRIRSALSLLAHTEQSLTQIALGCGFANSSTFSRAFRKYMDMTPTQYRDTHKANAAAEAERQRKKEEEIRSELRRKGYEEVRQESQAQLQIDLREPHPEKFVKNWNEVINIGALADLMRANMQQHVLYLQEQLHYTYIRVWNVFSTRMMISDGVHAEDFNYDLVNQALDFLVQHGLKPFLDFGRRPDTAIRSGGDRIFYRDDYIPFQNREVWQRAVTSFLHHIVSRYGQEEVTGWIYELSRGGFYGDQKDQLCEDPSFHYFDAYQYMYGEIRSTIPGAVFGGTRSAIVADWEEECRFAKMCLELDCVPDYLAYTVLPPDEIYLASEDRDLTGSIQHRISEEQMAEEMEKFAGETGLTEKGTQLWITEWNNSISNRNYLNDSCYRAAYIVRTLSRLRRRVDQISIMAGSDWISNYVDTRGIVNGGIGLLTKDGIRKPAFYALEFLNQLGTELLAEGEHWIATRKDQYNFYILCYHYTRFRNGDTMQRDVSLEEVGGLSFEDDKPLRIRITLDGMEESGEYMVRRRTLNHAHGSILDEWKDFAYDTRMVRQDIAYLDAVSCPALTQEKLSVKGAENTLRLEVVLQPQELTLLHILWRA